MTKIHLKLGFLFPFIFLWCGAFAQFVFIPNEGQWQGDFLFKAKGPGATIYLENKGITLSLYNSEQMEAHHHGERAEQWLDCHAIKIELLGANLDAEIERHYPSETYYNYFLGSDSSKWKSGLKGYSKLRYKNVYPGIDFEVYSHQNKLKYQFILSPGADASLIKLKYKGSDDVAIEGEELRIGTSILQIIEEAPYCYQYKNDLPSEVFSAFQLDENILSFKLGEYETNQELVIDPALIFSTFSGSKADNFGYTATYDHDGHGYSGGTVYSDGFPVTAGAFQVKWFGGVIANNGVGDVPRDIGILKYSIDGTKLLYATYIGGSHNEDPHSMVVDSDTNLIIFGNTGSTDFPYTSGAYDRTFNGGYDIYVAKLSKNGRNMLNCTFVGGSGKDGLNGKHILDLNNDLRNSNSLGWNYGDVYRGEVNVDANDNVYVITTTESNDLPVTSGAIQSKFGGLQDICVLKLNSSLSKLEGLTYFGGADEDAGYGLAFDSKNNLYLCGGTRSQSLQLNGNPYQDTFAGNRADGIVLHMSNDLTQLMHGTYFGTSRYDQTYFVQTDSLDNVYVTGQTTEDTFVTKDVKWKQDKGKQFIAKFGSQLDTLIWASKFGSGRLRPDLSPSAFLVDVCGRIYFSGWGGGSNFYGSTSGLYTTPNALKRTSFGSDFYLAVFARDMDTVLFSTYFGGDTTQEHVDGGTSRFDKDGIVYQSVCAGCGGYSDFPTTVNAVSRINRGIRPSGSPTGCNNALFKLDMYTPDLEAAFDMPKQPCVGEPFQLTNKSINAESYVWNFGDGNKSTASFPIHAYKSAGTYQISLVASNPNTCAYQDTIKRIITVSKPADARFVQQLDTCNKRGIFIFSGSAGNKFYWDFGDGETSDLKNPQHLFDSFGSYTVKLMVDTHLFCADTIETTFTIPKLSLDFDILLDSCVYQITFINRSVNDKSVAWKLNGVLSHGDSVVVSTNSGINNFELIGDPYTACPDTLKSQIDVPPNPIPDFDFTTDTCSSEVIFKNHSQNAKGFVWKLGNGDTSKRNSPIINYENIGTYIVELIANPASACAERLIDTVLIEIVKYPKFSVEIDQCTYEVKFIDESKNANEHLWIFDENNSSTSANPGSFQYKEPGKYSPILVIDQSDSNCIDSFTTNLLLDSLPEARFEHEMADCRAHLVFTQNSKRIKSYKWYFEDGTTDTIPNPDRVFRTVDSFGASLVVVSENGCVDSIYNRFFVDSVFEAEFEFTLDTCSSTLNIQNSSTDASQYRWVLNGEDVSNKRSPSVTFNPKIGELNNLHLYINEDTKCADSIAQDFLIEPYDPDNIFVPNIITTNEDGLNDLWVVSGLNSQCDEYEVFIYNRWGQVVYKQKSSTIFWDGKTMKANNVEEGTYYYILDTPNGRLHGTITVLY